MSKKTKQKPVYFCRVLLRNFISRAWPEVEKLDYFLAYICLTYPDFHTIAIFEKSGKELITQYTSKRQISFPLKCVLFKDEWFSNWFDEPNFGVHLREKQKKK
jgi:hypothetical protein